MPGLRRPEGAFLPGARPSIVIIGAICLATTLLAASPASNNSIPADEDQVAREEYARLYFLFSEIAQEEEWVQPRLYRKAAEDFREYVDEHPDRETARWARYHRGECHWLLGETAEALGQWEAVAKASDKSPSPRVRIGLAIHYFAEERYDKALEHFRSGATLVSDPNERLRCRLYVGICHSLLGEKREAWRALTGLLKEIRDGDVDIRKRFIREAATVYLEHLPLKGKGGRAEEAIQAYQKAYADYPYHGGDFSGHAWPDFVPGEVGRRLESFLRDLAKDVSDPRSTFCILVRIVPRQTRPGLSFPPLVEPHMPPDRLQLSILDSVPPEKLQFDKATLRAMVEFARMNSLHAVIRGILAGWDGIRHERILYTLKVILGEHQRGNIFSVYAARELAEIGHPVAIEPLVLMLRKEEDWLRAEILESLVKEKVRIDDSVVEAIFHDPRVGGHLRGAAARYIALRDSREAVMRLFEEIRKRVEQTSNNWEEWELYEGILEGLSSMRSAESAKTLGEIARSRRRPRLHREIAVETLGKMGHLEAVDVLVPLLEEPSVGVDSLAADALGQTKDPRAAGALLKRLRTNPEDSRLLYYLLRSLSRLGVTEQDEELFLPYAASEDDGIRYQAHALLRQTGGDAARTKLLEALNDKVGSVRWQAIRALGQGAPIAKSVSALIARYSKEPDDSLRREILKYLIRMTGVFAGADPEGWKKWWEAEKDAYDPASDRIASPARSPEADPQKTVTYFTLEVTSKKVIFVLDTSESMADEITLRILSRRARQTTFTRGQESAITRRDRKINFAKEQLIGVLSSLSRDTRFNIIWFGSEYSALFDGLRHATEPDRTHALDVVQGLSPEGRTNIFDSLARALEDPGVDAIYLLSDGEPNQGAFTSPEDILREVRKLKGGRGVTIHTIDLSGSSILMERLAEENGGRYVPILAWQ